MYTSVFLHSHKEEFNLVHRLYRGINSHFQIQIPDWIFFLISRNNCDPRKLTTSLLLSSTLLCAAVKRIYVHSSHEKDSLLCSTYKKGDLDGRSGEKTSRDVDKAHKIGIEC